MLPRQPVALAVMGVAELGTLTHLQKRLYPLMAKSSPTLARVFLRQKCGLTTPARELYSLFASMKLPHESKSFSASVTTHKSSQRELVGDQSVPSSGHAQHVSLQRTKVEENKTLTLKSSKDWPLPEPL